MTKTKYKSKAKSPAHVEACELARKRKRNPPLAATVLDAVEREGSVEGARRVLKITIEDMAAALGISTEPSERAARRITEYGERIAALPVDEPGPYLRALRLHAGLTVDEAAVELGQQAALLSKHETGFHAPAARTLIGMWRHWRARYPGLHLEDLCGAVPLAQMAAHLDALRSAAAA